MEIFCDGGRIKCLYSWQLGFPGGDQSLCCQKPSHPYQPREENSCHWSSSEQSDEIWFLQICGFIHGYVLIFLYYFLSTYLWLNRRRCDKLERRLINHHREKSTALWIVTVKSLRPCDSWHLFPTRSRSEQSCRWLCVTCLTWHHRGSWGGHSYQMLIILKKTYGIQSYSLGSSLTVRNWV